MHDLIEIERKFLVGSEDYKDDARSHEAIAQGFLNTDPERTVRVRIAGDFGYLTIKGKSNAKGTSRFEWETEIRVGEAHELLKLCEPGIIEKIRYKVVFGDYLFEVDEYLGDNTGLTVAEIELETEDESFPHPHWLGQEVTGDIRYYNSQLSKNPYSQW